MTIPEALIKYDKGYLTFDDLMRIKKELDRQKIMVCEHSLMSRRHRRGQTYCADCFEIIEGGPDGDGEND
jgi:uncharacterized protein with von Willebrand factor type A (vWA) domain